VKPVQYQKGVKLARHLTMSESKVEVIEDILDETWVWLMGVLVGKRKVRFNLYTQGSVYHVTASKGKRGVLITI
jgi:hypothetical protein